MSQYRVQFKREKDDEEEVEGQSFIRAQDENLAARKFLKRIEEADVYPVEDYTVLDTEELVDEKDLQKDR